MFGAFVAGAVIAAASRLKCASTRNRSRRPPAAALLRLPAQHANRPLNTPPLWAWTAVVILLAVAGKDSCAFARLTGESWRRGAIGTLANARGLVELIMLNAGLQAESFSPPTSSIMVLMAVTTTVMASPFSSTSRAAHSSRAGRRYSPQITRNGRMGTCRTCSALQLRGLTLRNRIVVSPMCQHLMKALPTTFRSPGSRAVGGALVFTGGGGHGGRAYQPRRPGHLGRRRPELLSESPVS